MDDLVARARRYATQAHSRIDQRRTCSNQPYDVHLKAVAELVAGITRDTEMIAAAWLHDTVEDTPATFQDIERQFGPGVAALVEELTDVSRPGDGTLAIRRQKDLQHASRASLRAKAIKLADIIDTSSDVVRHDPKSAKAYLRQAQGLMAVLIGAHAGLYRRAQQVLGQWATLLKRAPAEQPEPQQELSSGAVLLKSRNWRGFRNFSKIFTALDIAEPLLSFDCQEKALNAAASMDAAGASVAVLRSSGLMRGYLLRSGLTGGSCDAHRCALNPAQAVDAGAPLTDVIHVLTLQEWCFVQATGEPAGVIGRQDIQKPIVRMWLFGIITLFEQEMTQVIGSLWPENAWMKFVAPAHLEKAQCFFEERRRRNYACSLLDCLQLSDKALIMINDDRLVTQLGFKTAGSVKRVIRDLQYLRNNLAHAQDIVTENWPQIVRLARRMEEDPESGMPQ